jgi:hypothetical protein
MKHLILFFLLILSIINFAQEKSAFDCVDEFEIIETEVESQKTISYKIVSSQKIYTEETFEFSEGIVIISDLNNNLNPKELAKTIASIGVKNKLSKIIAFKSCKAVKIYYQGIKPTTEQVEYLEKNLIAKIEIDINKSLSRKEKKRNKKKRDFTESIAIEICKVLSKNKIENFSSENLTNAMVHIFSENVEKMMTVYDLSFEESSDLFMKDLTLYLIDNCKIVNEFTYKKE